MRITGPNGPTAATGKSSVRRPTSGTFSLPQYDDATPAAPSGTSGVATLSGIDALIALQGIESATDRRRRAVGRGKSALDALDDLKLALLSGSLDPAAADRLRATALGLTDPSGDPELDRVLAEIELRVEVELAKLQAISA
jgi:hypothetical protein